MRKYLLLLIVLLSAYQLHLVNNLSKITHTGEVIEKAVSIGRSSTHYLMIDFKESGIDTIIVHPIDYKRTSVGESYTVRLSCNFMFCAGAAYVPETDGMALSFSLFVFILCATVCAAITHPKIRSIF